MHSLSGLQRGFTSAMDYINNNNQVGHNSLNINDVDQFQKFLELSKSVHHHDGSINYQAFLELTDLVSQNTKKEIETNHEHKNHFLKFLDLSRNIHNRDGTVNLQAFLEFSTTLKELNDLVEDKNSQNGSFLDDLNKSKDSERD